MFGRADRLEFTYDFAGKMKWASSNEDVNSIQHENEGLQATESQTTREPKCRFLLSSVINIVSPTVLDEKDHDRN